MPGFPYLCFCIRYLYHNITGLLLCFHITGRFDNLVQGIRPVDDRFVFLLFDDLPEENDLFFRFAKPENMPMEEAAAVCDGMTMAYNYISKIDFSGGINILIYGASGSLSLLLRLFAEKRKPICSTENYIPYFSGTQPFIKRKGSLLQPSLRLYDCIFYYSSRLKLFFRLYRCLTCLLTLWSTFL